MTSRNWRNHTVPDTATVAITLWVPLHTKHNEIKLSISSRPTYLNKIRRDVIVIISILRIGHRTCLGDTRLSYETRRIGSMVNLCLVKLKMRPHTLLSQLCSYSRTILKIPERLNTYTAIPQNRITPTKHWDKIYKK